MQPASDVNETQTSGSCASYKVSDIVNVNGFFYSETLIFLTARVVYIITVILRCGWKRTEFSSWKTIVVTIIETAICHGEARSISVRATWVGRPRLQYRAWLWKTKSVIHTHQRVFKVEGRRQRIMEIVANQWLDRRYGGRKNESNEID
jgi:hypothetical protein